MIAVRFGLCLEMTGCWRYVLSPHLHLLEGLLLQTLQAIDLSHHQIVDFNQSCYLGRAEIERPLQQA